MQLKQLQLHEDVTHFLHRWMLPDGNYKEDVALEEFPHILTHAKVGLHLSATVVFHALSELFGPHEMQCKIICCNPSWYQVYPCYDTVLVTVDPDAWGMSRFCVAFGICSQSHMMFSSMMELWWNDS